MSTASQPAMQSEEQRREALESRLEQIKLTLRAYSDRRERLTPGGRDLLEYTHKVLLHLEESFNHKWNRLSSLKSSSGARHDLCDQLTLGLKHLTYAGLRTLDGARSARIPVELETLIQHQLKLVLGEDAIAVLHINNSYEYSVDPKFQALEDLEDHHEAVRGHRLIPFQIPSLTRETTAMHALSLGHEIGHVFDATHALSAHVHAPIPERWKDPKSSDGVLPEDVRRFQEYRQTVSDWTREVVSDLVAAKTLGPAALFAFASLVNSAAAWPEDSRTHPGPDRRCAIMIEALLKFADIESLGPHLEPFMIGSPAALGRRVVVSSYEEREDSPMSLAWGSVRDQIPYLSGAIDGYLPPGAVFGAHRWKEVEKAALLLTSGIPCGETSDLDRGMVAVDAPVILNAGWLVRLRSFDSFTGMLGAGVEEGESKRGRALGVLDGLILKSYEISAYRRGQA